MRARRVAGISGEHHHSRRGAPLRRAVGTIAQQLESRVLLSSIGLIKNIYPDLSGDIDVKFTQVTGPDAVDSGLFLD